MIARLAINLGWALIGWSVLLLIFNPFLRYRLMTKAMAASFAVGSILLATGLAV